MNSVHIPETLADVALEEKAERGRRDGEPSCLGVITSTGAGVLRSDGVHVIPIGCLEP